MECAQIAPLWGKDTLSVGSTSTCHCRWKWLQREGVLTDGTFVTRKQPSWQRLVTKHFWIRPLYGWAMLSRFMMTSITFCETENVFNLLLEKKFMITWLVRGVWRTRFCHFIASWCIIQLCKFLCIQCSMQVVYILKETTSLFTENALF